MRIKSYFCPTVEEAIGRARHELGADAFLIESRKAVPEARHLGEYEVVFAAGAAAPAAGVAVSPALAGQVDELKLQLDAMRRALTQSMFGTPAWLSGRPECAESYSLLAAQEVAPQLAREIVQAAAARFEHPQARPIPAPAALLAEIESRVGVDPSLGREDRRPRVVAFVGPPGSGKTTTLVKLAVHYGLAARRPVLLLSMDTYRVAAADQLRAYAAILGVGFQVLETVTALGQVIEENRGKELIFIDTPGYAFGDLSAGAELARFLSARPEIDIQLVLSSSMKSADLSRVIDAFEVFRPGRLLFTRLDETSAPGPILNETVRTGKPLSFFSTGQRIPEDLELASARRLAERIAGTVPGEVLSAA